MLPGLARAKDPDDHLRVIRNLILEKGETAGDIVCFSCSVVVRGTVTGDIVTFGGDVEVVGSVAGDVAAIGGRVRLHQGAKVEGDVTAFGGAFVSAPQAVVGGSEQDFAWFFWPGQRRPTFRGALALLAFHGVLLLLFYPIARRIRTLRMAQTLEQRPWWSLLGGVVAFLLITALYWAVVAVTMTSTLLLKYLSSMLWAVVGLQILMLGFGLVGLSCRLGRAMRLRSGALAGMIGDAPLGLTIAGTVLVAVAELIPVVGSVAFLVFGLLGMGATVVSLFGTFPRAAGPMPGVAEPNPAN
jgi:hypothetical protein